MPNIGRNDPCPCGSGRKYKRCCLIRNTIGGPRPETRNTTSSPGPNPTEEAEMTATMNIDLTKLTEDELIQLNRRIVERLRCLHRGRSNSAMMKFSVGDNVCFTASDGRTVSGIITKFNQKTVSLLTPDRTQWNVSPQLIHRVVEVAKGDAGQANIFQLKR